MGRRGGVACSGERARRCGRCPLCILIWCILSVQSSYRDRLPVVGANQWVIVDKCFYRRVREFMLQNDQAGIFRTSFPEMSESPANVWGRVVTGKPCLHIGMNLSWSRSIHGERPIFGAGYKTGPFSETCSYDGKLPTYS